jgi:undecaprenyl-diphosphatase
VGDGDDGGGSEARTGDGEDQQRREAVETARYWGLLPLLLLPVVVAAVRPIDPFSTGSLASVVAVDRASMSLLVSYRHALVTKFMTSVTGLGSAAAAAAFLGICHLADWDRELRLAGVSLVITGIVVASLMALVQRPFPPASVCVTNGPGLAPHSFPSGHAAAVTVFAAVARESEELPFRSVAAVAGIVALSRVYLGTHFLSDTVAGVAIGVGAVAVGRRLLRDRPADWTPLRGRLP